MTTRKVNKLKDIPHNLGIKVNILNGISHHLLLTYSKGNNIIRRCTLCPAPALSYILKSIIL